MEWSEHQPINRIVERRMHSAPNYHNQHNINLVFDCM